MSKLTAGERAIWAAVYASKVNNCGARGAISLAADAVHELRLRLRDTSEDREQRAMLADILGVDHTTGEPYR